MASQRNSTNQGFGDFGALGELLQIIQNHMTFMNEQEANVDSFISKQSSAELLRDAKRKALETEKELMQQIMNISEMNTFLNNIILIENLFNSFYTKQEKMMQEAARQKYATNIAIYERKAKPISDIDSFVKLMFAGVSSHMSSFKKWLKKVVDECKQKGVKMVSTSGAKGKNIERAFYKSFYVYSVTFGNNGFKQMTDVIRCSLVFDTFKDLYQCFAVIEKLAKQNNNGGILRCKDRFNPNRMPFGYRDILINMYCPGSKVVAEIQLHHTLFYNHKKISHTMYKKARLFEENEENMAYKYANTHIRKVVGDKIYEIQEGDNEESEEEIDDIFEEHECEMSAEKLFEKWKLTKYIESFINEEGFDEPEIWNEVTLEELKQEYGFKAGHAKKFIKFVEKLENKRAEFEDIKQKRKKLKKRKTKKQKQSNDEQEIKENDVSISKHMVQSQQQVTHKISPPIATSNKKPVNTQRSQLQNEKQKVNQLILESKTEEKKESSYGSDIDSVIITKHAEFEKLKTTLTNKLNSDFELKLKYRSGKLDKGLKDFHQKCGSGATILIVHTEFDHIFVCYTSVGWGKKKCWNQDEKAFLLLIRSSFGHDTPKVYDIKTNSIKYAVEHHYNGDIVFGTGPDVSLHGRGDGTAECKSNQAYNLIGNALCGGKKYDASKYKTFYFKYLRFEAFSVNKITSQMVMDSSIIDKKEMDKIENVLSTQLNAQGLTLELLYTSNKDGDTAKNFHSKCDRKGATITIVRTEFDHVFGCFTSIPWTSPKRFEDWGGDDKLAFLVLLRSSFGHETPKIYKIKNHSIKYAVAHNPRGGPKFGTGPDVFICCEHGGSTIGYCKSNQSYNINGNALCGGKQYKDTKYYQFSFKYLCYEVFRVRYQVKLNVIQKMNENDLVASLDSKIITDKTERQKLKNVLVKQLNNKDVRLKLLYRAGVVNSPREFHNKCDHKGATITIVHTEFDHVFGCYTSIPWQSDRAGYSKLAKKDDSVFLVLLRSQFGHSTPKIYKIKTSSDNYNDYGVWHENEKRPQFGGGGVRLDTCGNSGCGTGKAFDMLGNELCGGKKYVHGGYFSFNYKSWEVFLVS